MPRLRVRRTTLTLVALTVLVSLLPAAFLGAGRADDRAECRRRRLLACAGTERGRFDQVANNGDEPVKVLALHRGHRRRCRGQPAVRASRPEQPDDLPRHGCVSRRPTTPRCSRTRPISRWIPATSSPSTTRWSCRQARRPATTTPIVFFEMFDFADDTEQTQSLVSGRLGARLAIRVVGEIDDRARPHLTDRARTSSLARRCRSVCVWTTRAATSTRPTRSSLQLRGQWRERGLVRGARS